MIFKNVSKQKSAVFMENLKKNRKKTKYKKQLTFQSRDSNPRFSVIFSPRFEFSWNVRRLRRSNPGKEVKISRHYLLCKIPLHLVPA